MTRPIGTPDRYTAGQDAERARIVAMLTVMAWERGQSPVGTSELLLAVARIRGEL